MAEATIASFILRFTQEHLRAVGPAASAWRGTIRHVQSSEEMRFVRMEEALAFISRYVSLVTDEQPLHIVESE